MPITITQRQLFHVVDSTHWSGTLFWIGHPTSSIARFVVQGSLNPWRFTPRISKGLVRCIQRLTHLLHVVHKTHKLVIQLAGTVCDFSRILILRFVLPSTSGWYVIPSSNWSGSQSKCSSYWPRNKSVGRLPSPLATPLQWQTSRHIPRYSPV